MSHLHARRGTLLGFATGAVVLLSASAAVACTQFAGKIIMTGTNATGSGTYQGNGTDNTHSTFGYCTPPARTKFVNTGTTLNFTLAVSTGSCARPPDLGGGTADPLPAGAYDVRWIKSTAVVEHGVLSCFGPEVDPTRVPPARPWESIGSITVAATGTTTKAFSLPLDSRGTGNICVVNPALQISAPMLFIDWTVI